MGSYYSTEVEFPITVRKDNWFRDYNDPRDRYYEIADLIRDIPNHVDFSKDLHCYSTQGRNMDVICGVCSILRYEYKRNFKKEFKPSTLFLYTQIKLFYGNFPDYDGPVSIRDALKILKKIGVCEESQYLNDTNIPSEKIYNLAVEYSNIDYSRIERYVVRKVVSMGYPVLCGFSVYDSMDRIRRGSKLVGSRVGVICGYKFVDNVSYYIVMLPDNGVVDIPITYINDYGDDFWIIEKVKPTSDHKTAADIVRGYSIREDPEWDIDE